MVGVTGARFNRHIHGVDALQAMALSVNFIIAVLRSFQKKGYLFFMSETDQSAVDLPKILTGGFGGIEEEIANNQVLPGSDVTRMAPR